MKITTTCPPTDELQQLLEGTLANQRQLECTEHLDSCGCCQAKLEGIATGFSGVDQAFAIQAGREVRIIVRPETIDDLGAMRLARDVSKQIEESMEYPGQIKVTVIRETRATEFAR